MINTAQESPVEWLLMLLAQYRDGDIDHKEKCRFRFYPGLGMMDDRCETCQLADFELERTGESPSDPTRSL